MEQTNQLLVKKFTIEYVSIESVMTLHLTNMGVNDFAFFVGTRVEKQTNKLYLLL